MQEAWDEYYEVPTTKQPHARPMDADHKIDEWWDIAIEHQLKWLFQVRSFDVFIVNYTWLSKALELAPASVFKILDTHDQFADRRHLLVSLGIAPEFFFTTRNEEQVAFGRADLIWAIKDQERLAFSEYTQTPIITIPHLDLEPPIRVPRPDPEGYLRVGIVGSRNNINVQNISQFFYEAMPVLQRRFAPVRFMVAGSICEWLPAFPFPEIRLLGKVEDMRSVYKSVDIVIVPMTRSTGLKIRTGEALSVGAPLISTEHAFEGYVPTHPFQQLAGMREVAEAIAAVAFDRSMLSKLRDATRAAYDLTAQRIESGLRETRDLYRGRHRSIFLVVHANAFDEDSILSVIVRSTTDYFSQLGSVTIVVAAGDPSILLKNKRVLGDVGHAVVASHIVQNATQGEALRRCGLAISTLADIYRSLEPTVVIFDAAPERVRPTEVPAHLILRPAVASLCQPLESYFSRLRAVAAKSASVIIACSEDTVESAEQVFAFDADRLFVPALPNSHWLSGYPAWSVPPRAKFLILLTRQWTASIGTVREFLVELGFDVLVVSPSGEGGRRRVDGTKIVHSKDVVERLLGRRITWPEVAVDLSGGHPGLQLLTEVLGRKRIPCFTLRTGPSAPAVRPDNSLIVVNNLADLAAALLRFRRRRNEYFDAQPAEFDPDGGWSRIWRKTSEAFAEVGVGLPV